MEVRHAIAAGLLAALAFACSSDPEPNNGVNDVRKACAIRTGWANKQSSACQDCRLSGPAVPCECRANDPIYAKCHDQQVAVNSEAECVGVDTCVHGCNDDCACIDGCYAGKAACYRAASAVDGCLTDLCDSRCR